MTALIVCVFNSQSTAQGPKTLSLEYSNVLKTGTNHDVLIKFYPLFPKRTSDPISGSFFICQGCSLTLVKNYFKLKES